jgi:hypothetical protein
MSEYVILRRQGGSDGVKVSAELGDARALPRQGESVDLVFTSPPYATALDYPRAHFLAVGWMKPILGLTLKEYMARAHTYVGSERGRLPANEFSIDPGLRNLPNCQKILTGLADSSPRHAKLVQRYFLDMAKVLSESARVLRAGRHAIFVVCPSHIRKIPIATDLVFTELIARSKLRLKARHTRTIDARRRLLPYMDNPRLAARMSTEYVLIFQKV